MYIFIVQCPPEYRLVNRRCYGNLRNEVFNSSQLANYNGRLQTSMRVMDAIFDDFDRNLDMFFTVFLFLDEAAKNLHVGDWSATEMNIFARSGHC